jgi:thiamine-phosphate pyrophosphorylase
LTVALPDRLRVVVVTDRGRTGDDLAALRGAARGGATAIQLREKDLPAGALLRRAREIREAIARHGVLLLVNDRLDVALAAGADGVHLGESALPVGEARRVAGDSLLIGASRHDPHGVARAVADGADYVVFGPVRDTPSKRGILDPRGWDGLREAVGAAGGRPVVAIGGMDASVAREARAAGAAGVAVIRAVLATEDPEAAARRLRDAVGGGR